MAESAELSTEEAKAEVVLDKGQMLAELKNLRYRLARDNGMSGASSGSMQKMCLENIFTDKVLLAISEAWPDNLEALGRVQGLGPEKFKKFGPQVLTVCTKLRSQSLQALKRKAGDNDDDPPSKRQVTDGYQLTDEQMSWAQTALDGKSLFVTGEAGTGKSFLMGYVISELRKTKMVAVTASTGIAAASLGGSTINAFAGCGIAKGNDDDTVERVMNNMRSRGRWQETQVLVIDEVSMIDASLFTLLEKLARRTRGNDEPWGGLQLLLCGDFLQLPPVESSGFAFETEAWQRAGLQTAELLTPKRQEGDKVFLSLLSEVRVGICSRITLQTLAKCSTGVKPAPKDGIEPTRLYCVNKDVDAENVSRLAQLPGNVELIHAVDNWKDILENRKEQVGQLMEKSAAAVLKLKVNAQIIMTKNDPSQGVVNGTRGVIESWTSSEVLGIRCPMVRLDNGTVIKVEPVTHSQSDTSGSGELSRLQLPLKLGWALTVHRAQGSTLSRAELQLENAFDWGQVYVALSRVKSLAGLWIKGKTVTQKEVKAHPSVLHFYYS